MRPRYLLVASNDPAAVSAMLEAAVPDAPLELAFSNKRIALFATSDVHCLPLGDDGCVAGTLFRRHGPASPIASLDRPEAASIAGRGWDRLLKFYWGGYVAAMTGADGVTLLRDPSATFPCYFARGRGCTLFASDAELLIDSLHEPPEIDWDEVARDLFSAGVPAPPTSLRGIRELLAGFSVTVADELVQRPRWSPWDHVHPEEIAFEAAAERLGRTVEHCIRASTAGRERLLLSVSGGLDSSIVAACLSRAAGETTCLTMYDDEDPSGDERSFARMLCNELKLPLHETPYLLGEIELTEALGGHLPRSRDRTHALAYEHAHRDAAAAIGADAFVTGNGGDSVFGYSQSAAPIADRFMSRCSWTDIAATAMDVCRQTGCSIVDAAGQAIGIARRSPTYLCRPNPLFLRREIVDAASAKPLHHPWLDAPADALPGTAAHVASILRVQQSLEPDRSRFLPVLNPLMAQPIVETCLGIRSWQWRKGGIDRAVARQAFQGRLPNAILKRRLKGGPSQFAARLLIRFRTSIRERLVAGHLARQRIIDTPLVETTLQEGRICTDQERVRLLELIAAEAWLDHWLTRRVRRDRAVSSADLS